MKNKDNNKKTKKRKIHDIYDVLMKLIIIIWLNTFLQLLGVEGEVVNFLETEYISDDGTKFFLDFLCEMKDGGLLHIEFQHPRAYPKDFKRFHIYDALVIAKYLKTPKTIVINFTSKSPLDSVELRETSIFNPDQFFIGAIDFDEIFENINIKVKTNTKITAFEELCLVLRSLDFNLKNKAPTLKKISKLLDRKDLFSDERFELFKGIIVLEIENLLPEKECEEIMNEMEDETMAEDVMTLLNNVVNQHNERIMYEREQKAILQGRIDGKSIGDKEACERIARNLKNFLNDEDIAVITGLSLEKVRKL